jgi:hypothetical protein
MTSLRRKDIINELTDPKNLHSVVDIEKKIGKPENLDYDPDHPVHGTYYT